MNTVFLTKLKRWFRKVAYRIPSPLPVGMTEFYKWAQSIIDTYEFPDNDSVRFALAVQVMHSDSKAAYQSKHYFHLLTKKSMANQIAGQVMHDLKEKQKAEATAATPQVASSGPQEQPKV